MPSDDSRPKPSRGRALGGFARANKLSDFRKKEIAMLGAKARWEGNSNGEKSNSSNNLTTVGASISSTPVQLELRIEKQAEIDGVEMGVLTDGTPYLSGRGLARLCGINAGRISEMQSTWDTAGRNTMTGKVKEILLSHGVSLQSPFIEIKQRNGAVYAYPDVVCVAVLEFYAFEAPNEIAKRNFRLLAGRALAEFIYAQVGYDPSDKVPAIWKQFHDRMSLVYNSLPVGFFGVFKEIADIIVTLGQAGLHIGPDFVPDISVGRCWSDYWGQNDFDQVYGPRQRYDHNYPLYFPQAETNPQPSWCYPEKALGEFRRWFREDYIGKGKFKKYLTQKAKNKSLPVSFVQIAIAAYGQDDQSLPGPC